MDLTDRTYPRVRRPLAVVSALAAAFLFLASLWMPSLASASAAPLTLSEPLPNFGEGGLSNSSAGFVITGGDGKHTRYLATSVSFRAPRLACSDLALIPGGGLTETMLELDGYGRSRHVELVGVAADCENGTPEYQLISQDQDAFRVVTTPFTIRSGDLISASIVVTSPHVVEMHLTDLDQPGVDGSQYETFSRQAPVPAPVVGSSAEFIVSAPFVPSPVMPADSVLAPFAPFYPVVTHDFRARAVVNGENLASGAYGDPALGVNRVVDYYAVSPGGSGSKPCPGCVGEDFGGATASVQRNGLQVRWQRLMGWHELFSDADADALR